MKKTMKIRMKKRICRAAGKLAAAFLLLGLSGSCIMDVSATEMAGSEETGEENQETVNRKVTYVYHQHAGSSDAEGGCYHGAVYHTHKGNEAEGGECYQTPVYHAHSGDEQNGGECYQTPLCHEHTGNPEGGGGCFVPVYHSHSAGCYKSVSSSKLGCSVVNYWDTIDGDYEGNDFQYYEMSCGITIHGTNPGHQHTVIDCNKSGDIDRYTLGCGKTEETPESYVFDCEKSPGLTIDAYLFDCEKTDQTIDGYGLSCGKDEDTPCGRITITEHQGSNREETEAEITFEDLTGGEMQLTEDPYTWKDGNGNTIGTGNSITISENGTYQAEVSVTNQDVNKDSLRSEITIESIVKPRPPEHDKDSGNDGGDDEGSGDDRGNDDPQEGGENWQETDDESNPTPTPTLTPTPTPTTLPTPTPTPPAVPARTAKLSSSDHTDGSGENSGEDSGEDSGSTEGSLSGEKANETKEGSIPSATPIAETKTVTLEEKESRNVELEEIKVVEPEKKQGRLKQFFSSPVVQIISITTGTLAAVSGFLLLCYLLFMSVRIYNDNGEGKMVYLGRSRILLKEEGYTVTITDRMLEKTVTNRYCIKPGFFRWMKSDDEELMVCCGEKKVAVTLASEMIVVI